ncbi:MAG: cobalamin-dependent protein [Athalassotoga sp.]|uniref:cobalamin-dependent protein n=1 Tax=Athalassotoga sp. TaxID=2022597 RepID=UPI003D031D0F
MKIVGAAVENCVHVAGILAFLGIARDLGYETVFLGPATPVDKLLGAAVETKAEIVAVSYRLTPSVAREIFKQIEEKIPKYGLEDRKFIFGGTPAVAEVAKEFKFFDRVFSTEGQREIIEYLKGKDKKQAFHIPAQNLIERIKENDPYPLIRHHFGLSSLDQTIEGIEKISDSQVLDVISLAPDQNTQQFFFEPDKMNKSLDGAGGVPIRSEEDFKKLYNATRRGNYPLMRVYSGTTHLIKMAELLQRTVKNAWAAIPISWYNELDGRSDRKFVEAVRENFEAIKWHADRGIPVEINEPHQWGLRNAHDTLFVAMAYLSAYVAKKLGVKNYIAQYMFNTPPGLSPKMDLAKMMAAKEMIESLISNDFNVITEARPGLMAFPADLDEAKGQLAFSISETMFIKPQIVHVVAFTESDHAANADEVIESSKIARKVIEESLKGLPNIWKDKEIVERIKILKSEVKILLDAMRLLSKNEDPFLDPQTYDSALRLGYLDTPNFIGSSIAKGLVSTAIIKGSCEVVNPKTGEVIREKERLESIRKHLPGFVRPDR